MDSPISPRADIATDDDPTLIARAGRRDPAVLRAIMRQHNTRLYRIARGILRNEAEAEDAVQEAYLRAFTHLDEFRGESGLGTWLCRIVINEALGRQRGSLRCAALNSDLPNGEEPDQATTDDPERAMAQQEIRELVEAAIDELPERYRLVLIARTIEGMSVEATADLLSLRTEAVKTQLHRARALLRAELERRIGPLVLEAFPFAGARCERLTEAVLARLAAEPRISL